MTWTADRQTPSLDGAVRVASRESFDWGSGVRAAPRVPSSACLSPRSIWPIIHLADQRAHEASAVQKLRLPKMTWTVDRQTLTQAAVALSGGFSAASPLTAGPWQNPLEEPPWKHSVHVTRAQQVTWTRSR